jgi:tRNA(adenine34) deaminase
MNDNKAVECPFNKIYPSQLKRDDKFFMQLAYNQAIDAWKHHQVPVGAVIEYGGEVIASAYNSVELTGDSTAHAEILAITRASNMLRDWRLDKTTLYVTKEPCPMCAGAALMARIKRVVYGFSDPKAGCLGGVINLNDISSLNHHLIITSGVFEQECRELIQVFFKKRRQNKIAY